MNSVKRKGDTFSVVMVVILLVLILSLIYVVYHFFIGNKPAVNKSVVNANQSRNSVTNVNRTSVQLVNYVNKTIEVINYVNKTVENIIYNNQTVENITYVNRTVENIVYNNKTVENITYVQQTVENVTYVNNIAENYTGYITLKAYYYSEISTGIYNLYPNFGDSLVDFNVTNLGNKNVTISFMSEIQGYTPQAVESEVLGPHENKIISQIPLITNPMSITEITNANFHYKVSSGNSIIEEKTLPIKLYAHDTMLWGANDEYASWIAAWVTPHASEIDGLLRAAAEFHPQKSMQGYQCADNCNDSYYEWLNYTGLQAKAIYSALKNNYGITYINAPIAFASNNSELPQRVKLPADSIKSKSANCIEGAVLFASALEAIGINPYIVLIPGHAFTCWDVVDNNYYIIDNPSDWMDCVETTMIRDYSYEDAENTGMSEFYDEFDNGDFNSSVSKMIPLNWARGIGITPMG